MKDINIPLKLINLLVDGKYHLTKQFSDTLGIKCSSISNHIKTIRNWGVDVFSIPGKGYHLKAPLQLLDETIIHTRLPTGRLTVLPLIDSTNQYLIERIGTIQSGDACVAEYQMQGRGRRGRQWIAPFGNNLCLSLYWRLNQGLSAVDGLSLMVCIVMAEVLHRLGAEEVKVKWPNDLYLNDRKLTGILVEISAKPDDVAHVVIGAGINLAMHESAAGIINQNWINLQESGIDIDRNVLAAKLIDALRQALDQFEHEGFLPFIARWYHLDNFLNRPVRLFIGNKSISGIARGINAQGALLLEQDGKRYTYFGGEISLRNI
ncbi:bifunctional biotin--[acetyl-CoA-carboxylase] ligase/biotin operon repressor BirA [Candidatus Steffania adelgidicola]|uniref:Bifunctional ligase/repressor BirA n=1 Tax=Candidatus Steffania adelgidicola str. Klausen-Leopoldsdorf TaxID=994478 RepID=G3ADS3_9GAMM|nr:bifunctional biotin--[acetyl-CoA-carboxylase] ligase/biotin operon repressor BirA [Candidatus Steffania adelgidicola]UDG80099.1 Bifunctional ligase/repressor BirA [Candidatus Steffania adelgidicola]CCB84935.1 bifunctional protein BirA [Candidatus Steffania adelgidicola str. Klausen-Leopoldsdorf]